MIQLNSKRFFRKLPAHYTRPKVFVRSPCGVKRSAGLCYTQEATEARHRPGRKTALHRQQNLNRIQGRQRIRVGLAAAVVIAVHACLLTQQQTQHHYSQCETWHSSLAQILGHLLSRHESTVADSRANFEARWHRRRSSET